MSDEWYTLRKGDAISFVRSAGYHSRFPGAVAFWSQVPNSTVHAVMYASGAARTVFSANSHNPRGWWRTFARSTPRGVNMGFDGMVDKAQQLGRVRGFREFSRARLGDEMARWCTRCGLREGRAEVTRPDGRLHHLECSDCQGRRFESWLAHDRMRRDWLANRKLIRDIKAAVKERKEHHGGTDQEQRAAS